MLISPNVVNVEGWLVKASMSSEKTICLVLFNENTKESYTKFFMNEFEANAFISEIVEQ